jgi:serine phosphatase RsbU (regulator of sigma subunit)
VDRRQLVVRRLVTPAVASQSATAPRSRRPGTAALRAAATQGQGPIWLLTATLLAAALALFVGVVVDMPPPAGPIALPWWVLAAGFCVAEIAVVNYDFRRESHSFSMNELPLVFGLFFASAPDLVIATVVGAAAALIFHRRQTGMKLLFNLGHFSLGACLAVIIFAAVTNEVYAFAPASWIAALLATVATSALSTGAIFVAISLSERRLELRKLPEQLSLALLATLGSASLGLMGVGAAWHDPAAAWLLIVPVGTFFLAYRGYVLKRQERDSLEFLYRSARILDESPDLASGMSGMLRSACVTFRAELAQLALLSPHDGQLALLVTATGDTVRTTENVRMEEIDGLLHRALQSSRAHVLGLSPHVPGPDGHALRQVMLAPLRSESQTLGAVLVANRLGTAGTFKTSDLRLLQTLVTQLSVSLENGRLARTLTETAQRADRERHNALVLQRGILPPPLPRLPGASVAVRYVPGVAEAEVGGDWYDFMQLPGGDVGVAIGDVVGHDLEAAARMGQARSALRAYATEGHPPASLMERLNRLLVQTDPDFMGTCCYLQFSPRRDEVTLVRAGHPPPLMIGADGRARLVELDANLPLGVHEHTTYTQTTLPMPPGATLVLYTDGLVESRTMPLDEGLARIAEIPAQASGDDLERLAEQFVAHSPADRAADDVTLLLLRHEPPAAGGWAGDRDRLGAWSVGTSAGADGARATGARV